MVEHRGDLVPVEPDLLAHVDLALAGQGSVGEGHAELAEAIEDPLPGHAEPPQELRGVRHRVPEQGDEQVLGLDRTVAQAGGEALGPAGDRVVLRGVAQPGELLREVVPTSPQVREQLLARESLGLERPSRGGSPSRPAMATRNRSSVATERPS